MTKKNVYLILFWLVMGGAVIGYFKWPATKPDTYVGMPIFGKDGKRLGKVGNFAMNEEKELVWVDVFRKDYFLFRRTRRVYGPFTMHENRIELSLTKKQLKKVRPRKSDQ